MYIKCLHSEGTRSICMLQCKMFPRTQSNWTKRCRQSTQEIPLNRTSKMCKQPAVQEAEILPLAALFLRLLRLLLLPVFYSASILCVVSGQRRSGETASAACPSTRRATPSFAWRRPRHTPRTGGTTQSLFVIYCSTTEETTVEEM